MEQIDEYLTEEVDCGRMSGPFTFDETTLILKGPFQCSPIVVDVQPDKLRICRHLSKESKRNASVNSYIDTDKFPTRFGSAAEVAEIVSPTTTSPFPVLPLRPPSYHISVPRPTTSPFPVLRPPSPVPHPPLSVLRPITSPSYPTPFSYCDSTLTMNPFLPFLPDCQRTPRNSGDDARYRQVPSNLPDPPGPQAVVRRTRFGRFLH
jgi:hypothetical protein